MRAVDVSSDGISGNAGGVMCVRTPLRLEPRANPHRVVQPPRVGVEANCSRCLPPDAHKAAIRPREKANLRVCHSRPISPFYGILNYEMANSQSNCRGFAQEWSREGIASEFECLLNHKSSEGAVASNLATLEHKRHGHGSVTSPSKKIIDRVRRSRWNRFGEAINERKR